MNKTLLFVTVFILTLAFASAQTLTVVSDTTTDYQSGNNWYPTVSLGTSTISGATLVWSDSSYTANDVTFSKEFKLPSCVSGLKGTITVATDKAFTLKVNGKTVDTTSFSQNSVTYDISKELKGSLNIIIIETSNEARTDSNNNGIAFSATVNYDQSRGCHSSGNIGGSSNNNDNKPPVDNNTFNTENNNNEVPEFGVIGGAIILLAGVGIVLYRRK